MARKRSAVPAPSAAAGVPAATVRALDPGLVLMAAIWAVNFSIIKIALAALPELAFNALRFPFASLAVFVALRRRGPIPLPRREDVPRILALGVLGHVVYQLFFIVGIDRTRAGNASLLLAGTPIVVALLSALGGHERVGRRVWAGVVATVAGIALVVVGGAAGVGLGAATLAGDLIMVAASVAWSLYTVGSHDLIARHGSMAVTAWTLWVGTIGVVLLGLPELAALEWSAVPASAWASIGYAGVLGIGVAYLLWYRGVSRVGNTRTATFSNLVPVLALIVAWGILGEVPTAGQIVGAAVIIGGVTIVQRQAPVSNEAKAA